MKPACRCGCPRIYHEHFRDGTDCGRCGKEVCPAWRDGRGWRQRLRDLFRR